VWQLSVKKFWQLTPSIDNIGEEILHLAYILHLHKRAAQSPSGYLSNENKGDKIMRRLIQLAIIVALPWSVFSQQGEKVNMKVDLDRETGSFAPAWSWFGYDEPNYTYMKDGRKLLGELAELSPTPVFIRAHNLLTTGDGTAAMKWGSTNVYTEDADGNPIYDWTILDSIFDTWINLGIKPLVEMGFMPEALSTKPEPYRHFWQPGDPYGDVYTGWRYPPNDYNKWAELIYRWVLHSVDRYGREEVESWYWELWNEPDISYWGGTFEEYCKLYDYSADAVKRALPTARVGGPHVTSPGYSGPARFLRNFLTHCESGINYATGQIGSPLDFIGFHAKGAPRFIDGRVRMGIGSHLRQVEKGFEIVASFEKYKNLPVVIGECDPEGCAACGMNVNPENGYRNGTMFSSYTAASFSRIYDLAATHNINLLGIVSWSFEFEDQPWFHGFRDLSTNGVNKPVLNVFRMFGHMGGTRVNATSDSDFTWRHIIDSGVRSAKPDIGILATKEKNDATIMFWNYHDDDLMTPDADISITVTGLKSKRVELRQYRIDRDHSNSYEVWKKMGSPQNPGPEQYSILEESGKLHLSDEPVVLRVKRGSVTVHTTLQRQGVGMIKMVALER
jgi:xylan 1,4-beta-xylosidase